MIVMREPDLILGLLPGIKHMIAFRAICQIGDQLLEQSENSFNVDYDHNFDLLCWTHKLYLLPITLATYSTQISC